MSVSVPTGFIQVHKLGFRDHSCGWEGIPQRRGHRPAGTLANMFAVGKNLNDWLLNNNFQKCVENAHHTLLKMKASEV